MDLRDLPFTKAADLLAGLAELWCGRWPDRCDLVPVVVADRTMDGTCDVLLSHLHAGGRAVLCLSPVSGQVLTQLGLAAPVALTATGPNPLVTAAEVSAAGSGPLAGVPVRADQASAVPGDPVVVAGTQTLVGTVAVGPGTLVVVGSAGLFADGLLGVAGNRTLLWWAVTGMVAVPPLPSSPGTLPVHPSPLQVDWGTHPELPDLAPVPVNMPQTLRQLPPEVFDTILRFADDGHPSGGLLIRGIPFGDVPVTPVSPTAPGATHQPSELALLAVGRLLGQPVGYLPEHGGDLVQNIVPVKASAARQVSTSSAVTLMWHTEAAFHPHRPRFLLLACLRGDVDAATLLSSIDTVVHLLPDGVRDVLSQPRFRTAADESYIGSRPTVLSDPQPVLHGSRHRPILVFDADLMTGTDPEADDALRVLAATIDGCHTAAVLQQGDLLVVDNQRAVHGRSPFTPRFDGFDRWLQRTFVVSDLAACEPDLWGRVVATRFRA